MLLATLPRVLGPEEDVALPVSVFALEPKVMEVALSVTTSGPLEVAAEGKKTLTFKAVGDEVVDFRLRTKPGLGVATATVTATSGSERARQKIELDVRSSTARVDILGRTVKPADVDARDRSPGSPAPTRRQVSRVRLDLKRRLKVPRRLPVCIERRSPQLPTLPASSSSSHPRSGPAPRRT
jgi:hypothetical protein